MSRYIIALDQGTTSSRSIIFDSKGKIISLAQRPFMQIYPQPGWVEHDPMTILYSQLGSISEAFRTSGLKAEEIAAIGITNQRETTGRPGGPSTMPLCGSAAGLRRCAKSSLPMAGKRKYGRRPAC